MNLFARALSIVFTFLLITKLVAQTNPAEEKFKKVIQLVEKNKIENAEKQLTKLLDQYSHFGKGWDLLGKIKYYNYTEAKKLPNFFDNVTFTTKDENGNEIKNDSLTESLSTALSKMDPTKLAYDKWISTLKKATQLSNTSYQSSVELRNIYHKVDVDTVINDRALRFYKKAEDEFIDKNYHKAAEYYQRALKEEPKFYKAQLYLGDAYYFNENYIEAIKYFKECAESYPEFLEPKKYLTDAYHKERLYDKAIDAAIDAILTYPDYSMFTKLEDILYITGKELTVQWQPRLVSPNKITNVDTANVFINKDQQEQKIINNSWSHYQSAQNDIQSICNEQGIINKTNSITKLKYLEEYSWVKMIENSKQDEFKLAKELKSKGYLDCYIFVTCFHEDIYDQYKHFVQNNRQKIIDYFKLFSKSL